MLAKNSRRLAFQAGRCYVSREKGCVVDGVGGDTHQSHSFTNNENQCLICHCDRRCKKEVAESYVEEGDRC